MRLFVVQSDLLNFKTGELCLLSDLTRGTSTGKNLDSGCDDNSTHLSRTGLNSSGAMACGAAR